MAFAMEQSNGFTFIRPAATFSLREKESSQPPLPAGEGWGEGERMIFAMEQSNGFTLIRPVATFSLREKEWGEGESSKL